MRAAIFGFAFAAWLTQPATANETVDKITDACSREWGLDFAMIEHCRDRQIEAVAEFIAIRDGQALVDPYMTLLGNCFAEWHDQTTPADWPMMVRCYHRQADAYKRLNLD